MSWWPLSKPNLTARWVLGEKGIQTKEHTVTHMMKVRKFTKCLPYQ